MAGGDKRFGRNDRKCQIYKANHTERKNRVRKLKKIIKGFKEPSKFKVVETGETACISVVRK